MNIVVREIDTGTVIHSGWYRELRDIWAPAAEVVGAWFKASPDDVHCAESVDCDVIEINGKVVASIEWTWRRVELRRPMMVAAE